MKKINISLFLICCIFQSVFSWGYTPPTAKVTAIVVNEEGMPMEGIEVVMGFEKGGKVSGITNSTGKFSASRGTVRGVAFYVKKEGYYPIYSSYDFYNLQKNRWLPWNPEVTLVMRKIENPVPMYARDTHKSWIDMPVSGKEVGFDLIEFDWVSPYGKGKKEDFIFKLDREYIDDRNFEAVLTITFLNKFDGIQLIKEDIQYGSQFKLPRFAPIDGYEKKLVKRRSRVPGGGIKETYEKDNNYIFRVRSEEEDGKFVKAMYGKIQGDIRVDPQGVATASIILKYFLNPDYTRNLEFDEGRNLFK